MAKLKVLPHQDIISGFKGTIDFYVHNGTPCARKWPRSPGHIRTEQVMAQWVPFTYAVHEWQNINPSVRAAYEQMAHDTGLSARDWFIRSYLAGIYRYPTGIP